MCMLSRCVRGTLFNICGVATLGGSYVYKATLSLSIDKHDYIIRFVTSSVDVTQILLEHLIWVGGVLLTGMISSMASLVGEGMRSSLPLTLPILTPSPPPSYHLIFPC